MARFVYTVSAAFDDAEVCEAFAQWLRTDHAAKVIAAGALSAEVVTLEGEHPVVEVRYRFADRAAFERYEQVAAPALRAEGLARFGPERGVRMSRRGGVLEHEDGLRESNPPDKHAGAFVR